eukprot:m.678344 g.678344  ORF g.678344 m.678344 type:complete len:92 (-) comp22804_c2_seq8:1702-1977(-)
MPLVDFHIYMHKLLLLSDARKDCSAVWSNGRGVSYSTTGQQNECQPMDKFRERPERIYWGAHCPSTTWVYNKCNAYLQTVWHTDQARTLTS